MIRTKAEDWGDFVLNLVQNHEGMLREKEITKRNKTFFLYLMKRPFDRVVDIS